MLNAVQQVPHHRRNESWCDFLDQLGTASLTLVGFEGRDLSRIYDALEVCSKTRNVQAVEVFIHSLDALFDAEASVAPGLCLVYVPDLQHERAYRKALLLLSELADDDTLTVIPVLKPYESRRSMLDAIGGACPAYLNPESELRDFVAIFSAFLFFDPTACPAPLLNVAQGSSTFVFAD